MRRFLALGWALFAGATLGFSQGKPAGRESGPPPESSLPKVRHATLGFMARSHNRSWGPLHVDIENPGPEREGYLVAEGLGEYCQQVTSFRRPVWIPAHAFRSVTYPAWSDHHPLEPGDPADELLRVKLTDGGVQVWSQLAAIGLPQPEESLLVMVSDARFPSYTFLDRKVATVRGRPLARSPELPTGLPRHPEEYAGIEVLVLGDPGEDALTPLQVEALRDWVRLGGCLIYTGGPTADTEAMDEFRAMLPVDFLSRQGVSTLEDLRRWGPPPEFDENLAFYRMTLRDGRVILGTAQRPLAAARAEGAGQVVALALDTGNARFQTWDGAANFYRDLLNGAPHFFPQADRVMERSPSIAGLLSRLAGVRVLSRGVVSLYLALVVGGMMAVLVGFRFTRSPEWAWPVALALALAGGTAAIFGAARYKRQPQPYLNEIDLVATRTGQDVARVYATLGLFSPREQSYQLDLPDERVTVRPGRSETMPPQRFVMDWRNRLSVRDLHVRTEDMRTMFGQTARGPLPHPQAEFQVGPDGLKVRITNPGGQRLEDAFVKFNRLVLPVGDLPPGTVLERTAALGGEAGAETVYSSRLVRSPGDELRAAVRALFFPDPVYTLGQGFSFADWIIRTRLQPRGESPALYGWSETPLFPVETVAPAAARRSVGLWAIESEVNYEGPTLVLPKGMLELQMKDNLSATLERAEGRFSGTRPAAMLAEFRLPAGCPDLQVTRARLYLAFRSGAYRAEVRLAPRDLVAAPKPDPARFEPIPGGPVYVVADPQRYFNPRTRSFLASIQIEATEETGRSEAAASGVRYWQVRDLDMDLQGAAQ